MSKTIIEFKDHLELQEYLKKQFTLYGSFWLDSVANVAPDASLIYYYCKRYNQTLYSPKIDYEYWLRKERKKLFPNCEYSFKRRKKTKAHEIIYSYNKYNWRDLDLYQVAKKLEGK